ncbi:MAG: response regulator transcription factor [Chloroflexi bacterium]|nr:response regulator transcription factor [Chloroflexota bacterium]
MAGSGLARDQHGRLRVLTAIGHPLLRAAVREMLGRSPGVDLIGEAEDGLRTLEMAATEKPDVLILDVSLPLRNGLEAASDLRKALPGSKIIVLVDVEDSRYTQAAAQSGAYCVAKTSLSKDLQRALRGD